jgi:uncharacterized membrane protein
MTSLGVRKIATAGVLSAVIIVLGITRLGFITLPIGSITIMHVPVILGAILEGPVVGLITGFLFGLFSLIQAAMSATAPLDAAFVNPLFSIVPRLFIGPGAWLIYALISGNFRNSGEPDGGPGRFFAAREAAGIAAAAIGGTLINTALVLSLLGIFRLLPWEIIAVVAVTNAPVESGAAALITLAVVLPWKRIRLGGSRLGREKVG